MRYTALAAALVLGLAVTACSRPAEDTTVADTTAAGDNMTAMAPADAAGEAADAAMDAADEATDAAASAAQAAADAVEARGDAGLEAAREAGEPR